MGYKFGWGATVLTCRYLDYDPGPASPVSDFSLAGPMLGVSFQW